MTNEQSNTGEWQDCRAGDVDRLVRNLQRTSRRRTIAGRATQAGMLLLLLGLGYSLLPNSAGSARQLTCDEAMQLADEFITNELDRVRTREVDEHLAGCEQCTRHINQMRRRNAPESESRTTGSSRDDVAANESPSNELRLVALR